MDDDMQELVYAMELQRRQDMSITACFGCGCWVDSDKNPECFDEKDRPFCSSCAPEPGIDYSRQVEKAMNEGDYDEE